MSRFHSVRLSVQELGFQLADGRHLFSRLTLGFSGERTAVVGPNGSGKSTLLSLLEGSLSPTSGSVRREGQIARLPQRLDPDRHARVVDLLGVGDAWDALHRLSRGHGDTRDLDRVGGRWDLAESVASILRRVRLPDVAPERPTASLSGGEAGRVALAGLLLGDPDILLLDEPTNHLDSGSREALYEWLEGWDRGVVVVSHDRALLRRVDRILELGGGPTPTLIGGNFDAWTAVREVREEAARQALDRARAGRRAARRDRIEALERQSRRNANGARRAAKGGQPKVLLGHQKRRAETTSGKVQERSEEAIEQAHRAVREAAAALYLPGRIRVPLTSTGLAAGREVIRLEALAEPGVFGPITARWCGPVRVGITGPNGSGKSTLLSVLSGRRAAAEGGCASGVPSRRIALIGQSLAGGPESVLDHLRHAHPGMPEHRAREILDRFLFGEDSLLTPTHALSEGERIRLALARVLMARRPPFLLLLDEPTNHLDLEAVEALEAILGEYDGALFVASHDRTFLDALALDEEISLERVTDRRSYGTLGRSTS